jgi:predicted Zn-dependent protease with MMP-like domain
MVHSKVHLQRDTAAGAGGIPSGTVHTDGGQPERPARVRRRDRHGRGLRGVLAPPDVPLHRTRAERFDDLVLQAVARLEPQWEAHLSGIEFVVEEIPPADATAAGSRGPVPLSRLEPGSAQPDQPRPAPGPQPDPVIAREAGEAGEAGAGQPGPQPPRIVVYRRPLMIRAEGEEELGDLVFDVVVEEFARLLGIDPSDVDPGYAGGD